MSNNNYKIYTIKRNSNKKTKECMWILSFSSKEILNKVEKELMNLMKIKDKNCLEITEITKKTHLELIVFTEYLP